MIRRNHLLSALIALHAFSLPAGSATLAWPVLMGGGPCASTLQACIQSAAAGDAVVIGANELIAPDRLTIVDEDILIEKSLALSAAPGIDAVFPAGRSIVVANAGTVPFLSRISNLTLRRGRILGIHNSAASGADFRVERVRINELPDVFTLGCGIEFQAFNNSGAVTFTAGDNSIFGSVDPQATGSGICFSNGPTAGGVTINTFRNRIIGRGAGRILNGVSRSGNASGSVTLSSNAIFGPNLDTGIALQRLGGAGAINVRIDNNLVSWQDESDSSQSTAAIRLQLDDADLRLVNNTVTNNQKGILVSPATPGGALSGRVANNLISGNASFGLHIVSGSGSTVGNGHNLVFANGPNGFTPGAGTLTSDPQLETGSWPRPSLGSPALNSGNPGDVPSGTLFDLDGERRIALGQVDIGAFEHNGEASGVLSANSENRINNEVYVDHLPIMLAPSATLVASHIRTDPPNPGPMQNLGVYASSSPTGWSVFNQNPAVAMQLGQRFSVLAPAGSKTGLVHETLNTTISGGSSRIDHSALDARPYMVAVATPRWVGTYLDVPIGMSYSSASGGHWHVRLETPISMNSGLLFNIAVAPQFSNNAIRAVVGATSVVELRLEHPLLDDNPCAAPVVGRVDNPEDPASVPNPHAFAMHYRAGVAGAPGRWFVVAEGPGGPSFPAGAAFNVIVDGPQANRCRAPTLPQPDAIFSNDFE